MESKRSSAKQVSLSLFVLCTLHQECSVRGSNMCTLPIAEHVQSVFLRPSQSTMMLSLKLFAGTQASALCCRAWQARCNGCNVAAWCRPQCSRPFGNPQVLLHNNYQGGTTFIVVQTFRSFASVCCSLHDMHCSNVQSYIETCKRTCHTAVFHQ